MTVSEYLARWMAEYAETRVSGRTLQSYDGIIRHHLIPAFGKLDLEDLSPEKIQAYLHAKRSAGRLAGGGLSATTVHHHHGVLHKALTCAVNWGLLEQNPAARVKPSRGVPGCVEVLDEEATRSMLRALRGHPVHLPTVLAVGTGMRRGEILGLHWNEVDLDQGVLAVTCSLEQARCELTFKAPKTRRSRRLIALPGFVVRELDRCHRHRQTQRRPEGRFRDLVILRPDGSPWRPDSFSCAFQRQLKIRGLPAIRFHDLRHGHASHLLRQGIHPKVVSERLGHSSVGFTLDTYSHLLPGMQAEAAAKIDEALGGP